jgi:ABC-type polysaccharide/polyol phosphate transport system ATPase subunit
MIEIEAREITVEFPIYELGHRSLRTHLIGTATGGRLGLDPSKRITVTALDNVSFRLDEHDRVAVIGQNGAGKSVLLRTLAGIYPPARGEVRRQGSVNTLFDIFAGFDEEFSGLQNIYRRGYFLGLSRRQIDRMATKIADFADLGAYLDLPMRIYSSGMRLRLAFSIATSIERDILLMDEWIGAGDAQFQEKAEPRLHEFAKRSRILVLASHSEALLRRLCTKAILLHHGKLIAMGDIEETFAAYHRLNSETPPQETAEPDRQGSGPEPIPR